jgi:hypothetical protein
MKGFCCKPEGRPWHSYEEVMDLAERENECRLDPTGLRSGLRLAATLVFLLRTLKSNVVSVA